MIIPQEERGNVCLFSDGQLACDHLLFQGSEGFFMDVPPAQHSVTDDPHVAKESTGRHLGEKMQLHGWRAPGVAVPLRCFL